MVRVTRRDQELFLKINQAQWLSTGQIGRYFFPGKAYNAVNKRMRKLVHSGYLFCSRKSSTEEYLYRLTRRAKQILVEEFALNPEDVTVPRRLPQNLQHFMAINDLRWAFESGVEQETGNMILFAADRDFKRMKPTAPLIPDAIVGFQLRDKGENRRFNLYIEYDNGTENPGYFARTKIRHYTEILQSNDIDSGCNGFRVLIFAVHIRRLISLMKYSVKFLPVSGLFLFAVIPDLQDLQSIFAPMFLDPFNYFIISNENGKTVIRETLVTGNNGLRYYSLRDLPVLSGCPDGRTVLSV